MTEKASKTPYPPGFFSCEGPSGWLWWWLVLVLAVVFVLVCMLKLTVCHVEYRSVRYIVVRPPGLEPKRVQV